MMIKLDIGLIIVHVINDYVMRKSGQVIRVTDYKVSGHGFESRKATTIYGCVENASN